MTDKKTEALKLALEALEDISALQNHSNSADSSDADKAITAIREALMSVPDGADRPAQRKPLTDEEIKRRKPISADFVSFRAGVRCMEHEYGSGAKR